MLCEPAPELGKKNEKWKPLVVSPQLGKHPTHPQNCSPLGKKMLRWVTAISILQSRCLKGCFSEMATSICKCSKCRTGCLGRSGGKRCLRQPSRLFILLAEGQELSQGEAAPAAACSPFWRLAVCRASGKAYEHGCFLEADWTIPLSCNFFFFKFTFVRIGQ